MLDFLKLWKKKEPGFAESADIFPPEKPGDLASEPPGLDFGRRDDFPRQSGGLAPEQPPGFRPRESPSLEMPMPPGAVQAEPAGREFQLINAKLDAIKAGIDHLHARLDKIEQKEEKEIVAWR